MNGFMRNVIRNIPPTCYRYVSYEPLSSTMQLIDFNKSKYYWLYLIVLKPSNNGGVFKALSWKSFFSKKVNG